MIRRHYLKKWPGVVVAILSLQSKTNPVGAMVFALPPKQTISRYGGLTWELARLWVDDAMPRNTETWFIAQAIRWIKRQRPDVDFVVSYADPSVGHAGTIYKAANFKADGRTDEERQTPRFDYEVPAFDLLGSKRFSRRGHVPNGLNAQRIARVSKWRYVMPMNRTAMKRLGNR